MNFTESKNMYKELILTMENCEEISIPWGNVQDVEFEMDTGQKDCITDYSLSFVLDKNCSLYMIHPDNGVDNDPINIIKRLSKWKDVTHLELIAHDGKQEVYYVSSWERMSIDNDQEHMGQYVDIETHSDGTQYVRMTCEGVPSALPDY